MKLLVALGLGLTMCAKTSSRLASMPIRAVILGCVQGGVFMSGSMDFVA